MTTVMSMSPATFKRFREGLGITQKQVATATRVSIPAVSRFENHGEGMGAQKAVYAAKYLEWKARMK